MLKILAFAYDFPHHKTVQGLLHLKTSGFDNVTVLASPFKQLNIPKSKIRVAPRYTSLHPKAVAQALNYEYLHVDHDDEYAIKYLKEHDIGVILGARILKPELTSTRPIINMHPGYLPHNRGLDNLKWAVINKWPQAVAVHIIDSKIDRGQLLFHYPIGVGKDDTLQDLFIRAQETELAAMVDALKNFNSLERYPLPKGDYHSAVPDLIDAYVPTMFERYKRDYDQIIGDFYRCLHL